MYKIQYEYPDELQEFIPQAMKTVKEQFQTESYQIMSFKDDRLYGGNAPSAKKAIRVMLAVAKSEWEKANGMQKYMVEMEIKGRIYMPVWAKSEDDASAKSVEEIVYADIRGLEIASAEPVTVIPPRQREE